MKFTRLLLTFLLVLPSFCLAELEDENLIVSVPDGFKIDFQTKKGNMLMTEMVPKAESVKNWTEMVTTQIFLGMKNATPEEFLSYMAKTWSAACKDSVAVPITNGVENGYTFSIWGFGCPLNQSTGKPENTMMKAIKGNDSLYVVQVAVKSVPPRGDTKWIQYLRSIMVCDTRLADRQCPMK